MRFRPLKNASLSTTIFLLVAGTFVCLILLVLASVLWVTRRQSDRVVLRNFRVTETFLRQTLDDRSDSMQRVCSSLGRRPGVLSYLMSSAGRNDWATISDSAKDIELEADAQDVLITDQAGRALGESPDNPLDSGRSCMDQPGVAAATAGRAWKGIVSYKGRLSVAVSVPIFIPGQRFVQGTVSAFAHVGTPLSRLVAQALKCEVAFVVNGGIAGQSLNLESLPALPTIRAGETFVLPSPLMSRDKPYLGSYQTLWLTPDSAPLGVLILRPYAEATTLSHDLQAGLIAPFVASLALALIAGAAVARRVTQPLDGVVDAARELREGRWPKLFAVERGDEIGLLQTVFNEMTIALRASQARLLSLIDTDPLTELDNHRRFQDRLLQEMNRATASGESLSLLLLDIDYFQEFNQKFGHRRGDEVLKIIAKRLRDVLPSYAITARYGGEEFAILAPRYAAGEVTLLCEAVREAIAVSDIGLTISIGFAETQGGIVEPESLTLAAELALTQAKQLGRDRVCGFDAVVGADDPGAAGAGVATLDTAHLHRFLRDGNLATVQALAAAVDAKDPYTQGHSRRVAELAVRTAKHRGLSTAETDLLFITGTLHDVGKIGVPDRVLQKAGSLDGEERQLMETHPVLGELIVGKVPQLASTLPGIRSHHERWDGHGYPDRLVGDQIPIVARILALADTYDAMTSDRPYRQGMAPEIALGEIIRCAGSQFDPELAPVFVAVVRDCLRVPALAQCA